MLGINWSRLSEGLSLGNPVCLPPEKLTSPNPAIRIQQPAWKPARAEVASSLNIIIYLLINLSTYRSSGHAIEEMTSSGSKRAWGRKQGTSYPGPSKKRDRIWTVSAGIPMQMLQYYCLHYFLFIRICFIKYRGWNLRNFKNILRIHPRMRFCKW